MEHQAIHQIMPGFLYGDAVSNQALRIRELLRGWGYRSQVYAQYRDSRLDEPGLDYRRYRGGAKDVVIFHYSIGSPVTEFVHGLPGTVVPYYHNVTPAGFLRGYNEPLADLLDEGRRQLSLFRDVPLALAGSEYNRQEMLALGYGRVEVVPYFLGFDRLMTSAESSAGRAVVTRYADGKVNLLFVGRLVPNKRQDDLIRAFNAYHHLINPESRLLLIGSDANAPGYRLELETLASAFQVEDSVHFLGAVGPDEGFGGYYRVAHLFLSLSEHEGFGVPLLEAMFFDIPVLAFRSSGVPYAMGGAGVLFSTKRFDCIAELIDVLVHDQTVRGRVLDGQRRRLEEHAFDQIAKKLEECIRQILQLRGDGRK